MANPAARVTAQISLVRSTSMPPTPHPLMFKIEEELHKMGPCVTTSSASSSSTTLENACKKLNGLADIYGCVEEVLHLPSISQAFSRSNEKKWLEKELDMSVKLLDLCSAIKDMLVKLAEHAKEIQSDYRRRLLSVSKEFIFCQVYSKKETTNDVKKCQNQLKRIENMCSSNGNTCDLSAVSRVLIETRDVALSLLRLILSCLSMTCSRIKVSRWSLISKAMKSRKVACDANEEIAQLLSLNVNGAYSICFRDVEAELEHLFRKQIQNRVSLLNLLSL